MQKPDVLDISHHNEVVSWPAIREAGIFGIIHKATEGTGMVDKTYAARRRQAESAGLRWGAYHFNSGADPKVQADHFLNTAKPDANTLLALDWEDNVRGGTMTPAQARVFLERVMQKTGRPPAGIVIYGGNVLKEKILAKSDMEFFGQFPLWLCQYGPKAKLPKGWKSYWLWQYSEHGKIAGMAADGNVDLNVHGGKDLAAEWAVCTPPASTWTTPSTIQSVTVATRGGGGGASGGGTGLVIPAADPPKAASSVGIRDLIPVSRKATGTLWFKRGWKAISIGSILSSLGLAQDTSDQVGKIIADHWLAILITMAILIILFVKWIESLMVEDVNEGRATPSGMG